MMLATPGTPPWRWRASRAAPGRAKGELCGAGCASAVAAGGRAIGGQRHGHGCDAGHFGHHPLGGLAQGFKLAGARRIDRNREIDLALVDDDLGDEALAHKIGVNAGGLDPLQRFEHAHFGRELRSLSGM